MDLVLVRFASIMAVACTAAACSQEVAKDDVSPPNEEPGSSNVTASTGGAFSSGSGGGSPGAGGMEVETGTGGETGSGGGTMAGSGGAPPTTCEYPAGPYPRGSRNFVGNVIDPEMSWPGFDADGNPATLKMRDLHDCDGSRGINAILLIQASGTCPVCEGLAPTWNERLATGDWAGKGVVVHSLVARTSRASFDGSSDPEHIRAFVPMYREHHKPVGWGVWEDPSWSIASIDSGGTPLTAVIDPRTMIVEAGDSGGFWPPENPDGLDAVLARNSP